MYVYIQDMIMNWRGTEYDHVVIDNVVLTTCQTFVLISP